MITHLFNSKITVWRQSMFTEDGVGTVVYIEHPEMIQNVRLDPLFLRPGKDIPTPSQAGRAPDRVGVMFASVSAGFMAEDVIVAIPNDVGVIPVPGTFQILTIPDIAVGYAAPHHMEVQIVETAQALIDPIRPFPGDVIYDELTGVNP